MHLAVRCQPLDGPDFRAVGLHGEHQAGPRGDAVDRSETIFEPYMRASSDTRGTGLGLPLSRSLAQAMGGHLTGRSDGQGMGATFTVRLNAAPGESV